MARPSSCRHSPLLVPALLAGVSPAAAAAPVIDSRSTSPVTVVTSEQLEKLPTGRRLEDLIRSCPSNTLPTIARQPDVLIDGKPVIDLNCVQPADIEMIEVLRTHNDLRAQYGAAPLAWDPALADGAQGYVNILSRTGQLVHAPREGRGTVRENISQGLPNYRARQLMDNWLNERRYFVPGTFPNVSTTGDWYQVGHFSQMLWPTTTTVGCARGVGAASSWLVCRYNPGGNKDGKPVGIPVQAQVVSSTSTWIRPRPIGGDYTGKTQQAVNARPAVWIDVKTGKPVPTVIFMPGKGDISFGKTDKYHLVTPDAGDLNRAYDPVTKRNFVRESGAWIDAKTGEPVPTVIVMPGKGEISFGKTDKYHLVTPDAGDLNRAYDPVTGRNFAKVPASEAQKTDVSTPPK